MTNVQDYRIVFVGWVPVQKIVAVS